MNASLSVPKQIELVFDTVYLVSAAVTGIYLITASQSSAGLLWGIMAVTLAGGDAFHLLPRMAAAYTGNTPRFLPAMGIGKLITSMTMTLFYLLLWHCGLLLFSLTLPVQTAVLYLLAGIRILLCLLPQNRWKQGGSDNTFGIYRNIPFVIMGLLVIWLYFRFAGPFPAVDTVWIAVLVSFSCYLPVVLWAGRFPKVGMLMLPKTCAYLWIIAVGISIF